MRHVTILGFDYALASAITGVCDLLSVAGVSWNRIHGQPENKQFEVEIVTQNAEPVRCVNGLEIKAHKSMADVTHTDLLLIPTIAGNIERTLEECQYALPWLRHHHEQGADIASNCTGAFLLAQSGLLDNKKATTHWGFIDQFQKKFPMVNLQPEQLITSDGSIFCSGGGMAWFDMALFLIERYCGYDIASECAKSHVIDMGRGNQTAYSSLPGKRYHQDSSILQLQNWLDKHLASNINIETLANQAAMGERTFKRRFKAATGHSPINYLQSLRIEAAKKLLVSGRHTVEAITFQVGYVDVSSFIRLFKTHTGLSPSAYRARFAQRAF